MLDRLRELGRLPEVVNYPEWKAKVLSCYGEAATHEDWWHLPDGRMLHVMAEKRSDGGVTYLYVDETERLALESEYNALIDVQRETLDSLKEGVAVFGTDGRLKLFNSAFAEIWRLSRRELAEAPHIDEFIALARAHYEDPQTWARIGGAVTSISEEREPFEGQMVRPDNTIIDFAAMPLPDGATLFTFADVTDAKRYERALVERNEALVAADRMKNAFISHISYELRTPLTNIIGFSELLAEPQIGPLNAKQHEYLGDISASSKTLLAIIDDILTLATMDAGAMELKLGTGRRARRHRRGDPRRARGGRSARASRCTSRSPTTSPQFVADEARVRQILYNLLSNAVGFSKAGDIIRVSLLARAGHDRVHGRGPGRGHPQGPAVARVRALREPQPGLGPPRRRPRPLHRQEPGRAARGHGLARIRSRGRAPASPCAFPSTAGPARVANRQAPQQGPTGPLSAGGSRRVRVTRPMPVSQIIPGVSEAAARPLGRGPSLRRPARATSSRSAASSAPARPRSRAPSSARSCDGRARGDPEPDLHAGADLCRRRACRRRIFDLYRLNMPSELDELGLDLALREGIALVEWPERAGGILPHDRLDVLLEDEGEARRAASRSPGTGTGRERLARFARHARISWRRGMAERGVQPALPAGRRLGAPLCAAHVSGRRARHPHGLGAPARRPADPRRAALQPHRASGRGRAPLRCRLQRRCAPAGSARPRSTLRISSTAFCCWRTSATASSPRRCGRARPTRRELWRAATDALLALQAAPPPEELPLGDGIAHRLPAYDHGALGIEVELLIDWYWPAVHGTPAPARRARRVPGPVGCGLRRCLARCRAAGCCATTTRPIFSGCREREGIARVGIIDFQDAMRGPPAYDLVSLLQDARVDVPPELEAHLFDHYCAGVGARQTGFDRDAFAFAYAALGAQRTTKILGIFARLAKRDGKPHYLRHIPRLWRYLERDLAHPQLSALKSWYDRHLPAEARARACPA